MKRRHLDFAEYKKKVLKNPQVRKEYEKLQPEFEVINSIIEARIKKGLTQEELAAKLGTKQSAIARIEAGRANPTLLFLKKLADALGKKLSIQLQ